MITARQLRMIKLANLLSSGHPVSAESLLRALACSRPTLSRTLNDLRSTYGVTINYHRTGHTYQMVDRGVLTDSVLRSLSNTSKALPSHPRVVTLKRLKPKNKQRVSLYLPKDLVAEFLAFAKENNMTQSQCAEHFFRAGLGLST